MPFILKSVTKHFSTLSDDLEKCIKSTKIRKNVEESLNNFQNISLDIDDIIGGAVNRSQTSSLGLYMQKAIINIAKDHGFRIINDSKNDSRIIIDTYISHTTRRHIDDYMDYISNCDKDNPLCEKILNEYKNKIIISALNNKSDDGGYDKKISADFIARKDSLSEISIIEIKSGGNIDKCKAIAEKRKLLEIMAGVAYKLKDDIIENNLKINIFFATTYNKDDYYGGVESWNTPTVKRVFLNNELLISRDFWNFICQDEKAYLNIASTYHHCTEHLKKIASKIKEDIKYN